MLGLKVSTMTTIASGKLEVYALPLDYIWQQIESRSSGKTCSPPLPLYITHHHNRRCHHYRSHRQSWIRWACLSRMCALVSIARLSNRCIDGHTAPRSAACRPTRLCARVWIRSHRYVLVLLRSRSTLNNNTVRLSLCNSNDSHIARWIAGVRWSSSAANTMLLAWIVRITYVACFSCSLLSCHSRDCRSLSAVYGQLWATPACVCFAAEVFTFGTRQLMPISQV